MITDALADTIVREVAELPDRTSPADWPEAMLVTADELRSIVRAARGAAKPTPLEPTDAMIAAGLAAAITYVAQAKADQTLIEARGPIVSAVYKAMVAAAERTS
jgi:hypothetical protein